MSKCFLIPQRVVLAIMGFFAIVNAYTMRICLSVAITEMVAKKNKTNAYISSEMDPQTHLFDWSEQLQGTILSSFYWGYVITHLPGGYLCEKFGGKWVLSLGILSTAIFTLITPVAIIEGGSGALIAVRVLMGLGEGTTFPALSALLSQWTPLGERAKLGALVLGGGQIGTIIGNMVSGLLLHSFHWDSVFYFFGALGVLWFILFTLLCYSDPNSHPYISDKERDFLAKELGSIERNKNLPPVPWKYIFTSAPMWALIVAQIGHDWGFFVMVTDLPKYMADVLEVSVKENGLYSSLPYAVMWVVSILSGFVADWMITRGIIGVTLSRKLCTIIAAVGPGIFMVAASYAGLDIGSVVALFTISMGIMGTFYSGMKLNPLDLSPNYSATIMAITNGIGAITGIIVPIMVGAMTPNASLEEWRLVFWIAFAVFVASSIVYAIWASGEVQPWNEPENLKPRLIENGIEDDKIDTSDKNKSNA
ncbi:putative inorganic phosphate cotransporter isoform X2 [Condylostylus longicornis]|uniref:putative inorganic phosphate cotransporter isoform X2 n=1 Tax=Condylostylus longicornis TaxID=2530218 RepID=UPI00244DD1A4|nr:putative inorganic phosphate cotransporter isoform X2 [Condylostylus longicornis]